MTDKLIAPRRNEMLTPDGLLTRRASEYLEQNTAKTNDVVDSIDSEQALASSMSAQQSGLRKQIQDIISEYMLSHNAHIKRLEKEISELKNDIIAPFYKTKYDRLQIKIADIDGGTINDTEMEDYKLLGGSIIANTTTEIVNIRAADDINLVSQLVANETGNSLQFRINGSASNYLEINDNGTELVGSGLILKADKLEATTEIIAPSGEWVATGIDLDTGDDYKINGVSVLNSNTLGAGVVSSSLTSVGTLTNVNTSGVYSVDGTQVVSNQGAAVADASGGATIDAEARAAINALLARCRAHGLIA